MRTVAPDHGNGIRGASTEENLGLGLTSGLRHRHYATYVRRSYSFRVPHLLLSTLEPLNPPTSGAAKTKSLTPCFRDKPSMLHTLSAGLELDIAHLLHTYFPSHNDRCYAIPDTFQALAITQSHALCAWLNQL